MKLKELVKPQVRRLGSTTLFSLVRNVTLDLHHSVYVRLGLQTEIDYRDLPRLRQHALILACHRHAQGNPPGVSDVIIFRHLYTSWTWFRLKDRVIFHHR